MTKINTPTGGEVELKDVMVAVSLVYLVARSFFPEAPPVPISVVCNPTQPIPVVAAPAPASTVIPLPPRTAPTSTVLPQPIPSPIKPPTVQ
jgi:hypothetical protein